MPIPDFGQLLVQFEQLDNAKEQLRLQQQEQTSRNIAQAVGTMAAIPREGRAGYLATISQSLGLDTHFLNALADATPTPEGILMNRALEEGINGGDISPETLRAKVLGMTPVAYQVQQQVSDMLHTGKVPAFLKMLPQDAQGQAALALLSGAANLPDLGQLELMGDPDRRKAATNVRNQIAPDANNRLRSATDVKTTGMNNAAAMARQTQGENYQGAQNARQQVWRGDEFTQELGLKAAIAGIDIAAGKYARKGGNGGQQGFGIDPQTGLSAAQLLPIMTDALSAANNANAAKSGYGGLVTRPEENATRTNAQTVQETTFQAFQRAIKAGQQQSAIPAWQPTSPMAPISTSNFFNQLKP